jgi:hypothetical protein
MAARARRATALGAFVASVEAPGPGPSDDRGATPDELGALLGAFTAPPRAAPSLPPETSAEALLRIVDARVTVVPYRGSLVTPIQSLEGGVANGLDRARALVALLRAAGHEARLVRAPEGSGAIAYARTPELPACVAPDVVERLERRVADLAPWVWERLQSEREWASISPPTEATVCWTQVRVDGAWRDLIFDDTTLPAEARARSQPLDEAALEREAWTVTVRVFNEPCATPALTFSSAAADLHARGIAFTNLPSGQRLVPTLLVGERRVEGVPFTASELVRQTLQIETQGPGGVRRSTRTLVAPRGLATELERSVEAMTVARLLVLTGPVSDDEYGAAVTRTVGYAAARLRDDEPTSGEWLDAPPLRALGFLRGSRALAGRVGAAARAVIAYQDRPAIVIERTWVSTQAEGLRRHRGIDLVDPGHAFSGADAARAAVEQGIVDGALEELLVADRGGIASQRCVETLLADGCAFDQPRPAAAPWSDERDGVSAIYRLAHGESGLAGFRCDVGPQVVPILADGTGGASAVDAELARFRAAADALHMTVPIFAMFLPAGPLASGLVGYFHALGRAYLRAAFAIGGIGELIETRGASGLETIDEETRRLLEELLSLFPELVADAALAMIADAAIGALIGSGLAGELLKGIAYLGEHLARALLATAARGGSSAAAAAASTATRTAFREVLATARALRAAGWTKEEIRRFFEELGCFPAGTLVLTSAGPRPIETLRPGDRVLSRDPFTGAQGYRRIVRIMPSATTRLCRVVIGRPQGRTEAHDVGHAGGDDGDDGEPPSAELFCTPNHPIWAFNRGFVPAAILRVGDHVRSDSGELLAVRSVVTHDAAVATWNFEVEGWHSYFVAPDGAAPAVWVHNTCKPTADQVRRLLSGQDVTVQSIAQADALLREALPYARKVPGAGPAQGAPDWSKFKGREPNGMFHKDYLIDPQTGRVYGHGADNPHGAMRHINIKLPDGTKVVINIAPLRGP